MTSDPALAVGDAPLQVATKRCFKCSQSKPTSEFYIKNKKTGLLHHLCKRCCIERETERDRLGIAWRCKPENKGKCKDKRRGRYKKNPEKYRKWALAKYHKRRDFFIAKKRERYQKNREREIERVKKYRRENPNVVKAWVDANRHRLRAATKRWAASNPERAKIYRDLRRARKASVKCERMKPGYRQRLLFQQKFECPYCKTNLLSVKTHDDHVIPLSMGGEHTERNLQITCVPCNLRKHGKHPLDFAFEMGITKDPTLIAI